MYTDLTRHIPPKKIKTGMRALVSEGAFSSVFFVVTGAMWGSIFLIAFLRKLGASEMQIGILSAIPQVASMFQILASFLLEKYGHRKRFCILSSVLGKVFWGVFILLPFMLPGISTNVRILLSLLFVFLANVSLFFSNTSYISWVSDFVPDAIRGRLFAKKTIISSIMVLFIPMALGIYFDRYDTIGHYVLVFAGGIILGTIGSIILTRVPVVPMHKELVTNFWDVLRTPFKEPNFRWYVLFNFLWASSVMIMVPFAQVLLLEGLGCSKSYVGFLLVLNGLTNILFSWVWGYLSDKFSRKPFVIICAVFILFTPLVWAAVTPANYRLVLVPLYLLAGIFWAGLNINIFTMLMSLVPETGKSKYYAMFYITVGLGGALSPIIGGFIMERLPELAFGGLLLSNYQIIFFLSFLLRAASVAVLFKVKEPAEVSTGYVLKQFRMTNPFKVFVNLFMFSSNVSEDRRAAIIRRLGETRSPLVVDELVRSLDDTSRAVRQEAIRALGRVGDRRAVEPLLHRLNDQSKEVQELAAGALGELKDERSVPPLLAKLDSEDSKIRSTAAAALGKIGTPAASAKIKATLRHDVDPEVLTSSAKALSSIGEINAIWEIMPILRRTEDGPVHRELATAIGNLLGSHGEFYALLQDEQELPGSGCSSLMDEFFRSVKGLVDKESTIMARQEDVAAMVIASFNANDVRDTLALVNVLSQRVIFRSLHRIARKQRWPRELLREVVYADHIRTLDRLESIDYRLSTNAWFIQHLAVDITGIGRSELLLAFYALRNLGERLQELYNRPEQV